MNAFVVVGVYTDEFKVFGLVYKKLPKPLAAYKSKAVFGVLVADGVQQRYCHCYISYCRETCNEDCASFLIFLNHKEQG